MIEGATALDELDVINQARQMNDTRRMLEHCCRRQMVSNASRAGPCQAVFPDFTAGGGRKSPALLDELQGLAMPKLREYLCLRVA